MRTLSRPSAGGIFFRALAMLTITRLLACANTVAAMVCVGDCNRNSEVTVNELITMVNIALGAADQSICVAGDADGSGEITIGDIVAAVNSARDGCSPPVGHGVCGDQVVDTDKGEECDDGGVCIGGLNAGLACAADSDCQGEGVCDAFGFPGGGERKACSSDADCDGGATCVRCKPFGGDGCAANCTNETPVVFTLKPGESDGAAIKIATSGAVVHADIGPIALPFPGGTQTFFIGKGRNNRIPVAQKPAFMVLPRIPAGTIACACVRGVVVKTCGGTTKEADGMTDSTDCTADAGLCAGKKPCTAVAGPGNSTEGTIACDSLPGINYTVTQDAGSDAAGSRLYSTEPGTGGPGSALIAAAARIGTVQGRCTGTTANYGPDGEFCTEDDPVVSRGTPTIQVLTTGTGCASLFNANDVSGTDIGPFCSTGVPLSCSELASGTTAGAALGGAFTTLHQAVVRDIVVSSIFVAQ